MLLRQIQSSGHPVQKSLVLDLLDLQQHDWDYVGSPCGLRTVVQTPEGQNSAAKGDPPQQDLKKSSPTGGHDRYAVVAPVIGKAHGPSWFGPTDSSISWVGLHLMGPDTWLDRFWRTGAAPVAFGFQS